MIKIKFEVLKLNKQTEIIEDFLLCDNQTSEYIKKFFKFDDSIKSKRDISYGIAQLYNNRMCDLIDSANRFQILWDENSETLNKELFEIFGRQFEFDCIAYVNLNPIWPRFLEEKCFHVNVDAGDRYLLQSVMHEIVHFIWFEIWHQTFPKIPKSDYDYPNLSWIISEIAIEPIFRFSNLKNLCDEYPAYKYFYEEKIDGKTVTEIANKIYKDNKSIIDFQKTIYKFFKHCK